MADVKASTFPAVLKEYLPEYEPPTHTKRSSSSKTQSSEKSASPKKSQSPTKSSSAERSNSGKQRNAVNNRKQQETAQTWKVGDMRYEKLSQNWDQAKKDVRDEHSKRLNEKIGLQHELIKAQDELSKQKKEDALQEKKQLKDFEKNKKQSQQAELQKICKESLDEDRKKLKSKNEDDQENELPKQETEEKRANNEQRKQQRSTKPLEKRNSLTQNIKPMPPSQEMEEEEMEVNVDHTLGDIPEDVPWHHAQLYQLYGSKADYFLHPKLEPQPQKEVAPNKETLEGRMHVSAEDLWLSLRDESNYRLLREDLAIPKELKNSYSAFVRQCLSKNKRPVKRNFYATEDVPEMNRLLDKTQLTKANNLRHKTEIMYRSSLTNKDRTEVLMFNNPIPDLNNLKGEQSVNRYMPSWIDDASETSEASYMKWIESNNKRLEDTDRKDVKDTNVSSGGDSEWKFLNLQRRKPKSPTPKYHFLTEREARCRGEFTQRYIDQRESKNIPRPVEADFIRAKTQSEMGFSVSQSYPRGSRTPQSAPALTKQEVHDWYTSHWEPLSMNALIEYKQSRETQGKGDFSQGRSKMWAIKT